MIGYFDNVVLTTGNYIYIHRDGDIDVGERYMEGGSKNNRGTRYKADGTIKKYW